MVKDNIKKMVVTLVFVGLAAALTIIGVKVRLNIQVTEEATSAQLEFAEEQVPAVLEGDMGEIIETTEYEGQKIPTVDEVDGGGLFKDVQENAEETPDVNYDLGAVEWVDTTSPDAFKNSTLGRCIIAGNYFGAQCVSLARAFWWGYADRDVSTCGTGLAKGMMNCWEQNAGDDFKTIWTTSEIIKGTWIVTDGSYTGHICMALGPVVNGYVACLGENQGGASCGPNVGGSATNIINLSVKNFIGGYIPLSYIPPEPEPEPTPEPEPVVEPCKVWNVKKGDTLGKIMKKCEGKIKWGAAMNEYASHWYSTKFQKYLTVYDGWTSYNGVGLFAGDIIEYRD